MTTGAVSHALKTQLRIHARFVPVGAGYRVQSLLEFLGYGGAAHGGFACRPSRSRHEKALGNTADNTMMKPTDPSGARGKP